MRKATGTITVNGHQLHYCGITDRGRVRSHNEDDFLILEEAAVFCVADGAGGHRKGEVASRLTLDGIRAVMGTDPSQQDRTVPLYAGSGPSRGTMLEAAIHHANGLCRQATEKNIASTVVAFHFHGTSLDIAHVGDSRAYRFHQSRLELLTEDHSLVNYLYQQGEIGREERLTHPKKNVILRAVGIENQVKVSLSEQPIHGETLYLLCSDGLTSMVDDPRLETLIDSNGPDPGAVSTALLHEANRAGGRDNITIICIQVT